ncbi:stalk domain-containing protein [Pseudobacteroides cellulosolvens]|uniref:Copper amine oxidase-like domain-containing protein n=1 Tax=Pseudobacteroides cellulosolvens ATCC 35603 = DSM 2933 TaxID=398512 RepID=A0A0L6JLB2_9FIRM|nr:stalk domain-containing protein [Pseudobacteroides cellulosolvens]KNY26616.1 copper amine oxidase-like domain-containing protein [Pseudobacteroides cellulosolvens ATCC 35603 = DSM 2933]
MKKITSIFLVFAILSLSLMSFSASSQITVFVDGDKLDFKDAEPFIEGGRTLVPFRAIAEALGAEVGWDASTKTVTIIKGDSKDTTAVTDDVYASNAPDGSKNIKIIIGEKNAEVNGNKVQLDVPAKIATGRTYVPLRFVSEAMEMGVNWDAKTKKITIDTPEVYITLDKNNAEVGDIVKATVNIKNFYGFAGFQVNLKYDPEVIQPIDTASNAAFTDTSLPDEGTLLKGKFSPTAMANNDVANGTLTYGSAYINMEAYKKSGKSESTGSVAVFNFKVLKKQQTTLNFQNSSAMTNAKNGTMLFNWDGTSLTNYKVKGAAELNK